MNIQFHSTVIITNNFDKMKVFYQDVLQQEIKMDFGNCISFQNGLSIWKLTEQYPIAQKLNRTFDTSGNKNLEFCFETDEFEKVVTHLKRYHLNYLHEVIEENWGQLTVRFYDPEDNLIEIGETIPCFIKRFYKQGMSIEEISKRTSVPIDYVSVILSDFTNV